MDEETIIQSESLVKILQDQLRTALAQITRPVVQWQLLTIILILLVSWLLPEAVRKWLDRRNPDRAQKESKSRWRRWAAQIYQLYTPITSLVLTYFAIWLFESGGYPNGILRDIGAVFWFWLAYRAVLMILYARFGEAVRPYHSRILTPLFLLLIFRLLTGNLATTSLVADATLVDFTNVTVTVGGLFSSLVVFYLFFVAGWALEEILNRRLPDRLETEPGLVQTISTLTRYVITGLGIVLAFAALGLDATSLALIAGGLSVGIGIGLRDIIANFFSGLLLLFEQTLRPGDVIELDGRVSEVERISLRATTVRTRDNVNVIIPNATFTTEKVTTLTKEERRVRNVLSFSVRQDSDPHLVRKVVEEIVLGHPWVLAEPAPSLRFDGYDDANLFFILKVWVNRPERRGRIKSDLFYMIWDALADQGIELADDQLDLNLRRGWEKLRADQAEEEIE
jgi:potassium efflux system protein